MHIKTGTWDASSSVCEPDTLCDPAVLVTAANSEPHIRNRRLSPGSGTCGGGGGGGCVSGGDQQTRQPSPETDPAAPGPHTYTFSFRREKERKGHQHKGRGLRRESQKGLARGKGPQKDRWVEDSLALLKPPPAFPVKDSPAKLQPAVSYASKVKAGATGGVLEDDRPAIGVLLQNQWGLSFISETRPVPDASSPLPPQPTDTQRVQPPEHPQDQDSNGKLLLSCRHLMEALNFHNREWNALCNKQKKDPNRVMWYKDVQEHPA